MADIEIDEYVTDVPKEIKKLIWRIKDLLVTLESCLPTNPSIEFDIGESIGLASKWKMEIIAAAERSRHIQLCVSQITEDPEMKRFSCTATLKRRRGQDDLVSFKLNPANPSVVLNNSIIHQIGKDLLIQVEFVLCSPTFVTNNTGNDILLGGVDVLNDYGNLLNTGDNSDFVIQVKKLDGEFEEIRAHKDILSARCSFFKTMLDTEMQEWKNGTWIIEDLSPESIKIMLNHIYTGKLDDDWKKVPDEMVRAADKYNLPILLNFLNRRLHCVCTFANALNLRRFAKLHELDIAVKNISAFICSNMDRILG